MDDKNEPSISGDIDNGIGFGIIPKIGNKLKGYTTGFTTGFTDSLKNIANLPAAAVQKADQTLDWATDNAKLLEEKIEKMKTIAEMPTKAAGYLANVAFKSSPGGLIFDELLKKIPSPAVKPETQTTTKPGVGGGNNQIGGLKQLVNEKKIITKRIAKTLKSFHRTNTRKRRRNKSKRVRFAL